MDMNIKVNDVEYIRKDAVEWNEVDKYLNELSDYNFLSLMESHIDKRMKSSYLDYEEMTTKYRDDKAKIAMIGVLLHRFD